MRDLERRHYTRSAIYSNRDKMAFYLTIEVARVEYYRCCARTVATISLYLARISKFSREANCIDIMEEFLL